MQQRRASGKRLRATRTRTTSLNLTEPTEAIDLKLQEAIERLERVSSKAMLAVGSMLRAES